MIHGQLVNFRHAERADIPTFVSWFNSPATRAYLLYNQPMSLIEEERWFDTLLNDPQRYKNFYCIESRASGVLVGTCGLHHVDDVARWVEFGIVIGPAHQNQGFGSDAVATLLRWCFDTLNLNRVQLGVHADNARAIKVYERCGFALEGTRRQTAYRDGHYVDMHMMAILKSEWLLIRPTNQP